MFEYKYAKSATKQNCITRVKANITFLIKTIRIKITCVEHVSKRVFDAFFKRNICNQTMLHTLYCNCWKDTYRKCCLSWHAIIWYKLTSEMGMTGHIRHMNTYFKFIYIWYIFLDIANINVLNIDSWCIVWCYLLWQVKSHILFVLISLMFYDVP